MTKYRIVKGPFSCWLDTNSLDYFHVEAKYWFLPFWVRLTSYGFCSEEKALKFAENKKYVKNV